jgi:hypothetical protein
VSVTLHRLGPIAAQLKKLDQRRAELTGERDKAIIELIDAGHSRAKIAGMTGISAVRVGVVAKKARAEEMPGRSRCLRTGPSCTLASPR